MNGWNKFALGIAWVTAASLCASPLLAQQEGEGKPKPAAREYPPLLDIGDNQQDVDAGTQTMQPDVLPLIGVQNPTLGVPQIRHSYWVPGIEYTNAAGSNSWNLKANSGWNTSSFVNANVSLLAASSHGLFSANYSGGGFFSTDPIQGNGTNHQLTAAYQIDLRRWQLLFVDQFSYLPQSAFGFGGTTGLAFPGIAGDLGNLAVPLPGLQNAFVPDQSILTTNGPRYSNASAVQLTYKVSSRGAVTLAGVYGVLEFTDPGNVDNESEILNLGYNYAISRTDTIGVAYLFSAHHYPGDPQAIGDHVGQFAYGRKITGKLALKLAAGPEVTTFRVATSGSSPRISGSGNAMLTYAFARSSVALSYEHGMSGGSGVFSGSEIDEVGARWSRQLTRMWNVGVNFGYAKNSQILSLSGVASPAYDSWSVGARASRAVGRAAVFSLGYQAQIQGTNVAICGNPTCGTNYTLNQVLVTFQWHSRPLVLR
jgi:hypothetical protein